MDMKAFFKKLSGSVLFPNLTTAQEQGMTRLIDVWGQWYGELPVAFLAAALIQIHHETGGRMRPVLETFSSTPIEAAGKLAIAFQNGRLPWVKKPYWNPDENGLIWVGRGDIQVTHKDGYARARAAILETYGVDIPLDENPDLALEPVVSAVIAFEGMVNGLFRNKKLEDFYSDGEMDYVAQRAIVNGDSKDPDIAVKMKRGRLFEEALLAAGAKDGITPTIERFLWSTPVVEQPEPEPAAPIILPDVTSIQERLHAHGFGEVTGKIDGIYGSKTAKAIKAFESKNKIKLDHVDTATWQALQQPAVGEKTQ